MKSPPPPAGDATMATYEIGMAQVIEAASKPGALERNVLGPGGPITGGQFMMATAMNHTIHSWDLAKATGQDTALDPGIVEVVWNAFAATGVFDQARGGGVIGPKVAVPESASLQDRLLGEAGCKP